MADPEKQVQGDIVSDPSLNGGSWQQQPSRGRWGDFVDSFKPVNMEKVDTTGMTQAEIAAALSARQPLKRKLKGRHIQMIAIGGSIGTGLFIGSGGSFSSGGPAAVVICFSLIGIMLFCTMMCLGEMAVRYPVAGSFAVFSTRFLDPSWGFAMGWNYALQWLVVYPLELIAGAIVIGYWKDDNNAAAHVNPSAWVALFWVVIGVINIFGVRGYGEAEFVFAVIKVIAVIGFCIFGIVIAAGGGPNHQYIGAHYWYDPGAFAHGFKGVVAVFVNAAFAFAGTELAGLAAAESENPAKSLPRAIKQVFWRILLFYIVSLTIVSMLVPYTDPGLGAGTGDGRSSPFVIAIARAGVSGLPSVFNAVIIVAVLSVANSSVYGCSRTLAALAVQGQAPKILGYIDRQGRPLPATIVTLLFGLLCFLASSDKRGDVFDWLLALSGLSSIFTWGSVCLAHIRYRMGMYKQNRSLEEVSFLAFGGIWTAIVGFVINGAVIVLQFWVAAFPISDGTPTSAGDRVQSFFKAYLSVPVIVVFWLAHKIWYRRFRFDQLFVRSKDMDLDSGLRVIDREVMIAEVQEEKARIASKSFLYRSYRFWC